MVKENSNNVCIDDLSCAMLKLIDEAFKHKLNEQQAMKKAKDLLISAFNLGIDLSKEMTQLEEAERPVVKHDSMEDITPIKAQNEALKNLIVRLALEGKIS